MAEKARNIIVVDTNFVSADGMTNLGSSQVVPVADVRGYVAENCDRILVVVTPDMPTNPAADWLLNSGADLPKRGADFKGDEERGKRKIFDVMMLGRERVSVDDITDAIQKRATSIMYDAPDQYKAAFDKMIGQIAEPARVLGAANYTDTAFDDESGDMASAAKAIASVIRYFSQEGAWIKTGAIDHYINNPLATLVSSLGFANMGNEAVQAVSKAVGQIEAAMNDFRAEIKDYKDKRVAELRAAAAK